MENADENDIAASLQGDSSAYARLVKRHEPAIARLMSRFARDCLTRDELVQSVFVEAYFGLSGYRRDAPIGNWLARIATRIGYRFWKRHASKPLQLQGVDLDQFAARAIDLDAADATAALYAVFEKFKPRDRLVLTLIYLEGCELAEVSQRTGWTISAVKMRAMRARRQLRRLVQEQNLFGD